MATKKENPIKITFTNRRILNGETIRVTITFTGEKIVVSGHEWVEVSEIL